MNQVFLLYIGEDLSRDNSMDSMREVNSTAKFLTEGVEDAAYVSNIPTAGTEVIAELTGGDSGSTAKRMKKYSASRYGDHFRSSNIKVYHQATVTFE